MTAGEVFRKARHAAEVKLHELAHVLCVSPWELSDFEYGAKNPESWDALFEAIEKVRKARARRVWSVSDDSLRLGA